MLLLIIFLVILLIISCVFLNKNFFILTLSKRVRTNDGTDLKTKIYTVPGKTVFGNNFDVWRSSPEIIYDYFRTQTKRARGKGYLSYFFGTAVYNITNAEDAEVIFQSQDLITKSVVYSLLKSFLGDGLLLSTDKKWHFRRKLLTPAFHFNILQNFVEIFKEETNKVIKVLNAKIDEIITPQDIISQFTLNNVCETALGVKLDDIEGSDEYRQAIHKLEVILVERSCNPFMFIDFMFRIFGDYAVHSKCLKILHEFSSKVIEKKRLNYQQTIEQNNDEFGKKRRYAMLDTLLAAEATGDIDHRGICDEVNTFMFEGYDTTSTCLLFALLNLSLHSDIQEKCYKEVEHLADINALTVFDLNKLHYLECVIKETLRLYPSVPFLARYCPVETELNGIILPRNSQVNIHVFDVMRDEKHFPHPNVFDPERFLPENTTNRHPFAFVPFSAGPRNCIGQKFAMLEIKLMLLTIIQNFKILPVTRLEELSFEYGLLLRTKQNIKVRIVKRNC